jgi:hypothetical protein
MPRLIDVLLLLALPASGKSEIRRFLALATPERCREDFRLGPTVQLDDYPYVHMMRRISQELRKVGKDGIFFDSDELPMKESRDWGTLIELINEDFGDLTHRRRVNTKAAGEWLLGRFDAARSKVGAVPAFRSLPGALRASVAAAIDGEAAELARGKNREIPDSLDGRTIVIEFARGGPDGAAPPLPAPLGYEYSLSRLRKEILQRAAILYVWVTPEESRRRNAERADPDNPGSILHHGVPTAVMLGDYGCDDMDFLIRTSGRSDHVKVVRGGKTFLVPVARFDNRIDKTSFARADPAHWKQADAEVLHRGLAQGLARLAALRGSAAG